MKSEYETILSEVFCDTLTKYAFMFGDELSKDELPVNGDDYLQATIAFHGYQSGNLALLIPMDLGSELAANVLGSDPDDDHSIDDALDALKEFINVVCGQFLTAAFDEGPIFDLLPPSISRIGEAEWKSLVDSEKAIGFMVEDVPALISVCIEQETYDDSNSNCR